MGVRHADRPCGLPSGKSSGNAGRQVTHKSPVATRQKDEWCYPRFLGFDARRGRAEAEEGVGEAADKSLSAKAIHGPEQLCAAHHMQVARGEVKPRKEGTCVRLRIL
jgi:hypothetical protein